jgi:hypothetical protein
MHSLSVHTIGARPKEKSDARKTAILFLSHLANDKILEEYRKISEATRNTAKSYFLLHVKKQGAFFTEKNEDNIYRFTDDISKALQHFHTAKSFAFQHFRITKSFFPYSVHFPLLHFFIQNSNYDYYWLVEYDVRFSGDWKFFFESFQQVEADFLTCRIRSYFDEPKWYWWRCIGHPEKFISLEKRLSSFNPIYRISKSALIHLHQSHRDGWYGHYEVLIPTLLYNSGFKLAGIGGNGKFVQSSERNKFYTGKTFRWRPVMKKIGTEINKLYHPIKL